MAAPKKRKTPRRGRLPENVVKVYERQIKIAQESLRSIEQMKSASAGIDKTVALASWVEEFKRHSELAQKSVQSVQSSQRLMAAANLPALPFIMSAEVLIAFRSDRALTDQRLRHLLSEVSTHPDPPRRKKAAAVLYDVVMLALYENRGAVTTAANAHARADMVRTLAKELRGQGVPPRKIAGEVRKAWIGRRLAGPVPTTTTIRTHLKSEKG